MTPTITPPTPPRSPRPEAGAHSLARLSNTTLGCFTLGPVLGVGRTGVVFRAMDVRDHTEVALKVFLPAFSHSDEDVQRFTRAARTMMPLRHLNLVDLYHAGRTGGHCWLSMELIEGPSVAWLVKQTVAGRRDWRVGLRVLVHVTRALIYLHGQQVLHRNLTPTNFLTCRTDGMVKVGDLVTAKAQEGTLARDVTTEGQLIGDLPYLAPECTFGDPSAGTVRSDLYGLGAVVYAVLTGRPPFEAERFGEAIEKIRLAPPPPPRSLQPGIPLALEGVVLRLLAKDPARRFPDAAVLLRALVHHRLID